jgi:hypothetical protein
LDVQVGRGEAVVGIGQPPERFAEMVFLAVWANVGIAQKIVHAGYAGGGEVAQPAYLHGRRFPGEDWQPIECCVAGEVD